MYFYKNSVTFLDCFLYGHDTRNVCKVVRYNQNWSILQNLKQIKSQCCMIGWHYWGDYLNTAQIYRSVCFVFSGIFSHKETEYWWEKGDAVHMGKKFNTVFPVPLIAIFWWVTCPYTALLLSVMVHRVPDNISSTYCPTNKV